MLNFTMKEMTCKSDKNGKCNWYYFGRYSIRINTDAFEVKMTIDRGG